LAAGATGCGGGVICGFSWGAGAGMGCAAAGLGAAAGCVRG
jgi:hypothetical protein